MEFAPRKSYPSEVTDEEWAFADPYLTLMAEGAPKRHHGLREDFDALRWIGHSGAQWRYLPTSFLPWEAVYQQSRRSAPLHERAACDDWRGTTSGSRRRSQPSTSSPSPA